MDFHDDSDHDLYNGMFHVEMSIGGRDYPFWFTSQEKMLGVFTEECEQCQVTNKLPKPSTTPLKNDHSSEAADVYDYMTLEYITFSGAIHEDKWSTRLPTYT
jgi:hypothetical protein